jgi:hypothetical protein
VKFLFALVFLLGTIINPIKAQVDPCFFRAAISANPGGPVTTSGEKIRFNCHAGSSAIVTEPSLVIDGIPYVFSELGKLNPDDIASIEILKEAGLATLCNSPGGGVLIITTKSASLKKFIIKDFLTGEKIPAATICFTSDSDSIETVADSNGVLSTGKLKRELKYDMRVSSAGYKTLSTNVKDKEQEIFLERNVKECDHVTITCIDCRRTIHCGISVKITREAAMKVTEKEFVRPIYPNPVQRNHAVYFEFNNDKEETMQLNIFSLTGNKILRQPQKISKGFNLFSVNAGTGWSAGVYLIQLRDQDGSFIKQEKLVVQ